MFFSGELGIAFAEEFFAVDDETLVGAFADELFFVPGLDGEDEAAAVYFYQLGLGADGHADGRRGEVGYVELRADGVRALVQIGLHEGERGVFHKSHELGRAEHVEPAGAERLRGVLKRDGAACAALYSGFQSHAVPPLDMFSAVYERGGGGAESCRVLDAAQHGVPSEHGAGEAVQIVAELRREGAAAAYHGAVRADAGGARRVGALIGQDKYCREVRADAHRRAGEDSVAELAY